MRINWNLKKRGFLKQFHFEGVGDLCGQLQEDFL